MKSSILKLLGICMIVLLVQSQRDSTSSSEEATTTDDTGSTDTTESNSTDTSSNTTTSNETTTTTTLTLGSDCQSQNAVGADPCEAIDEEWCCYYSSSQLGDGPKVESYTCSYNPSIFDSLFDTAADLVSEVTTDDSLEYTTENYCANSVLLKVSLFMMALFLF